MSSTAEFQNPALEANNPPLTKLSNDQQKTTTTLQMKFTNTVRHT